MAEERSQRRLAAILAADVVGYSRLMETDEAATLAALKSRRKNVLDPLVAKHQGRIFKTTGDGVLVEFASAVNAVQCAVDLQQALAAANSGQPEDRQIVLRIGVNLGDVMVEGGDLYGDGVNIAARLEALAEPGGILVSGTVYDHIKSKVKVGLEDIGAQTLKNIAEPVRAYRADGTPGTAATAHGDVGERPTIALLPFVNMSGDRAQDYIGDGLTESIITGLSRFRDLNVIASNSSFVYKGKAVKVQDASRELGAGYILEGSVQKAGERVRITAQLIDGKTGRHIWAERYDRGMDDIFAVQDEVTGLIVGTLATSHGGRLRKAWQERRQASGTGNMLAMDYFLRGMDFLNRFTRDDNELAKEFFAKSAELDPGYAKPIAKIAWAHYLDANLGWTASAQDSLAKGLKYAKAAIALDDDESWGHYALAGYHVYTGRFDLAISAYEKALSLNPTDADILMDFAMCLCSAGRKKEAIEIAQSAMRLNPHCPEWYLAQMGELCFEAHRYAEAVVAFERLTSMDTVHIRLIEAASHAALGQADQARCAVERALQLDPQATVRICTSAERAPYGDLGDREHFRENLRRAGLPE
jgi:adenylate cyclase